MKHVAMVYDPAQSQHILRDDHVFRPHRLQLTYELLDDYGAFDGSRLITPRIADESDIVTFHTPEYIDLVRDLSRGKERLDAPSHNISEYGDNPPYEGMYEAAALVVGASLTAADLVTGGDIDVAFNISGGLHHAGPNRASGFCIFNDAVIAIMSLLERGLRIAYVDIDAHHGDGVQRAFYDSDRVLTISLHESGRYLFPGTGDTTEIGNGEGKGYSVNIPFFPNTDDETYLWAFREIVPPLVKKFDPDVLVTQLGCDSHYLDPLTDISLTTAGYTEVIKEFRNLSPKWMAIGGGGYDMEAVVRLWTLAYGAMLDRDWPNEIPDAYRERYGIKRLRDTAQPTITDEMRAGALHFAKQRVSEVKRAIFPIHKLKLV
ncbi:MAG: acetoin utilization protein AcuC [Chloroflexota bacterium]|nr:acetoin utilization protein AcuC [Chloroflexota bacterium]